MKSCLDTEYAGTTLVYRGWGGQNPVQAPPRAAGPGRVPSAGRGLRSPGLAWPRHRAPRGPSRTGPSRHLTARPGPAGSERQCPAWSSEPGSAALPSLRLRAGPRKLTKKNKIKKGAFFFFTLLREMCFPSCGARRCRRARLGLFTKGERAPNTSAGVLKWSS